MNAFVQHDRLPRLSTALGPEALVLMRLDGTEALNGPLDYSVGALATCDDLNFDALLGADAIVSIGGANAAAQFDDIITEARCKGPGENGQRYDLCLRPWFGPAEKQRNQRIFHHKTMVGILQELLADYGHLGNPHLEMGLCNDYPELEHTVQHRESDLDFVRRPMERFGRSFHLRHGDDSHTLVLTDDALNHAELPPRPYYGAAPSQGPQGEHFWPWGPEQALTTGATRLPEYNFKTLKAEMESDRIGVAAYTYGHGRTLVHFHCNLEKAWSMRCRVSQNGAIQGWIGMVIPRIGMELVVEFPEGDPDKPRVTGCVYNGRYKPSYPLPQNKTKGIFKTGTHKGSGFNEPTFEDEGDQEKIYVHGQRGQEIVIENDRSKTIDRYETLSVGPDHLVQIRRNHEETVFGKSTFNVTEAITNNTPSHSLMASEKFIIKGPGGKTPIDAGGITLEAACIFLKGAVSMGGRRGAHVPAVQSAARDGRPIAYVGSPTSIGGTITTGSPNHRSAP